VSIAVSGLCKRLGGEAVVRDVSFDAPEGRLTTLLGPSGSGKSTVLRMIAGLLPPDSGRVTIDGQDATTLPAQRRNVGFVFQQFALFQHLTARENIAFGLRIRKQGRAEITARVDELLRLTQLEALADRMPVQLSGGQRQRVALARALAPRPQVLLLDEPFGALDAKVRQELRAWLRQLHLEVPVTTVMVTHDQEEALELSDRVVVMNAGLVEQIGAPADIYDRPATAFVASFVGAANVLSGQVRGGQAALGPLVVTAPGAEGQVVRAFVRPHDVELVREVASSGAPPAGGASATGAAGVQPALALPPAEPSLHPEPSAQPAPAAPGRAPVPQVTTGRVTRLVRVGWQVKLHLVLGDGQPLVVQMTRDQVEAMRIQEGDRVFVNLKEAKVFVQDYAI
jgi:sulfate transport system ATP-binding protein